MEFVLHGNSKKPRKFQRFLLDILALLATEFLATKKMVEKATMESKTEATMWKNIWRMKMDHKQTGVKSDPAFCLGSVFFTYRENKL